MEIQQYLYMYTEDKKIRLNSYVCLLVGLGAVGLARCLPIYASLSEWLQLVVSVLLFLMKLELFYHSIKNLNSIQSSKQNYDFAAMYKVFPHVFISAKNEVETFV